MPKIIEHNMPAVLDMVVRAKDIGVKGYNKYIGATCEKCGVVRWTKYKNGKPKSRFCLLCGNNRKKLVTYNKRGYKYLYIFKDEFFFPMCSNKRKTGGYVAEHRLVVAKCLGRLLHSWEIIHHKNGIKFDNRIENLEIVTDYGHKQATAMEIYIQKLEAQIIILKRENELIVLGGRQSWVQRLK